MFLSRSSSHQTLCLRQPPPAHVHYNVYLERRFTKIHLNRWIQLENIVKFQIYFQCITVSKHPISSLICDNFLFHFRNKAQVLLSSRTRSDQLDIILIRIWLQYLSTTEWGPRIRNRRWRQRYSVLGSGLQAFQDRWPSRNRSQGHPRDSHERERPWTWFTFRWQRLHNSTETIWNIWLKRYNSEDIFATDFYLDRLKLWRFLLFNILNDLISI